MPYLSRFRPLLLVLAGTIGCGAPPPSTTDTVKEAPETRRPVPSPEWVTGAELKAHMTAQGERVRVYNFWATWCPPCIAEMPILRTFALRHPDVDVIMVNVDQKVMQDRRAQPTIRNNGMDVVPQLLLKANDPNVSLKTHVAGWPEQLPVTIVVKPDGTRAAIHMEKLDGPELEASVARAR